MTDRRFHGDTRAASIAITHALTLGITALLITTLLFSTGSMLDQQKERVIRAGLLDVGDSVVTELHEIDRTVANGNVSSDVNTTVTYPDRVGGVVYTVRLSVASDGTVTLYANSSNPNYDMSVPTKLGNTTAVCEGYKSSGEIRIYYDAGRECLTIGGVDR
ncbi:DUF7266 family protein [Halapricum desulfuricans]|uniref:Pilin/Flagellin, FlaG/FlaF family n=1 Tax=Halapricum desulfuricans TaxID=2841257 RepID=A0A897NQ04_9EURY|nr:hypothetical protein [Halapricum desulfuricans]QSG14887.1 Pilin/Flagellin, FlaG/FlaF family [Halapricum desulfuricans]